MYIKQKVLTSEHSFIVHWIYGIFYKFLRLIKANTHGSGVLMKIWNFFFSSSLRRTPPYWLISWILWPRRWCSTTAISKVACLAWSYWFFQIWCCCHSKWMLEHKEVSNELSPTWWCPPPQRSIWLARDSKRQFLVLALRATISASFSSFILPIPVNW